MREAQRGSLHSVAPQNKPQCCRKERDTVRSEKSERDFVLTSVF